ncbi:hypothetical protein E3E29_05660 [Thermococcus sp. Bubb.Bath]|nr:hypothetical protein [Thermococcus sp. Bubb.Bath]
MVNLGIGAIILGIVAFSLPGWRCMPAEAGNVLTSGTCGLFKNLAEDLELSGKAFAIPPYENLPRGGIFIPVSKNGRPNLGRLFEGRVVFSEPEPGLLLSPVPGQGILDEMEDVSGAGIGYAASAFSGVLGRLGLPEVKVFEDGENIEAYVETECPDFPYADPVVSALLVALAAGAGEVLVVEDTGTVKGYLKLVLRKAGGVEKWL